MPWSGGDEKGSRPLRRAATVGRVDDLEVAFREAMARVPAPVSVITTTVDATPTGTTVSAFASLSISPPMVVFALDNRGAMLDRLRQSGRAGVNILAGHQADVAVRFAARSPERFTELVWHDDHGLPRIDDAAAWLRCESLEFLPGGDHTIVLATVVDAESGGDSSLGYHLRQFRDNRPGD